jgi:hypothetical protein
VFPPRTECAPSREPSLTLGSLERALCSLAALGSSLMEEQKALQASLEAVRTSLLYAC